MKKLSYNLSLIILGVVVLISCNAPFGARIFYKFTIQNNSSKAISFQVGKNYPDVAIPNVEAARVIGINPLMHQSHESGEKWSEYFRKLPADTLTIFFFSQDTIKKYDWAEVQTKYMILKRKDISLQDLEKSKYILIYP